MELLHPFNPLGWLASIFSSQRHRWIKNSSYENKRNDHHLKKIMIMRQILLVSTIGNVLEQYGEYVNWC